MSIPVVLHGRLYLFLILIPLYGRRYSSVYNATSHTNPARRAAVIHFNKVLIFTPSFLSTTFLPELFHMYMTEIR